MQARHGAHVKWCTGLDCRDGVAHVDGAAAATAARSLVHIAHSNASARNQNDNRTALHQTSTEPSPDSEVTPLHGSHGRHKSVQDRLEQRSHLLQSLCGLRPAHRGDAHVAADLGPMVAARSSTVPYGTVLRRSRIWQSGSGAARVEPRRGVRLVATGRRGRSRCLGSH